MRLWKQTEAGGLPDKPTYELPLPDESAAYDVGDVLPDSPGLELVLLRSSGLTILSFASPALATRELRVDGPTIAPAQDERGLDRLQIVYTDFGPEPWLLVPMLGQATFVSPSGAIKAKLDVGARANYFVQQRPGPLLVDSDVQLLLDVPRISVGDVDGDGTRRRGELAPPRRARVPAARGRHVPARRPTRSTSSRSSPSRTSSAARARCAARRATSRATASST